MERSVGGVWGKPTTKATPTESHLSSCLATCGDLDAQLLQLEIGSSRGTHDDANMQRISEDLVQEMKEAQKFSQAIRVLLKISPKSSSA